MQREIMSRGWVALSVIAAIGFSAVACGNTQLLVEVNRTQITAGGIDYAVITATFGKGGDTISGQSLHFETTAGSFNEQDRHQQAIDIATDSQGRARAKLFSSIGPDTATVTVTYEDLSSDTTASKSITVQFGTPTGNSIPLADSVRLVCDAANIGAFRRPMPDIRVPCTLTAQTVDGRTIPLSALNPLLFAEAGTLLKQTDETDGSLTLMYTPKGGNAAPVDVDPVDVIKEPSHRGAGDKMLNPRDGLVTLMAVVKGQEQFSDDNGNGQYDEGEAFTDLPEPFLDQDDDGQRDENERFVDTDGNGTWDAGNGTWEREASVMGMYKILWSGALWNDLSKTDKYRSRVIISGASSPTTPTVLAIILDQNLNPVAGFADNADELQWAVDGTGVSTASATEVALKNSYGFVEFDKTKPTEVERWMPITKEFTPELYQLELRVDQSMNAVVSAQIVVSPGPRSADDYVEQVTERLTEILPLIPKQP